MHNRDPHIQVEGRRACVLCGGRAAARDVQTSVGSGPHGSPGSHVLSHVHVFTLSYFLGAMIIDTSCGPQHREHTLLTRGTSHEGKNEKEFYAALTTVSLAVQSTRGTGLARAGGFPLTENRTEREVIAPPPLAAQSRARCPPALEPLPRGCRSAPRPKRSGSPAASPRPPACEPPPGRARATAATTPPP